LPERESQLKEALDELNSSQMIINILQNELLTSKALAATCEVNLTTTIDADMHIGPDGTEILYRPFFLVTILESTAKEMDADMDIDPEGIVILYFPFFFVDTIAEYNKTNGCSYGYRYRYGYRSRRNSNFILSFLFCGQYWRVQQKKWMQIWIQKQICI